MNSCFAYVEIKGKCIALKETKCKDCNFYKTKEEVEESREKVIERIKSLDIEKRDYISETYYGGKLEV
ncbi:hypothetical protein NE686_03895 [Tissierella carlieri]|uniref:Uncharacterized protein n=1 Tax=Tissierella carlieri TaxID=689904 RepID=A0ABT1S6X0_9FIRM|nr:hypothetical protein [Tissierella carlieri]MCQ4922213.1 hypothetical protein [Tissierella carlieri]